MPQLCESGLCNKCPVCRQENWREKKTNQTVIIPIKEADIIFVSTVNDSSREKKTCWEKLPPCRQIWEYIKITFSEDFVELVDEQIRQSQIYGQDSA